MKEKKLEIGIDEKVGIKKGLFLGMQHVLSMDLYVFPVILASIIGLSMAESTYMIQMCHSQ